jgi:hypothetical protein
LWVADGDLVRVQPTSGALRSFDVGGGAVSVALNGGVWIALANGGLTRFDPGPRQLRVTVNLTLASSLTQVAANEGDPYIWAIGGHSLYRVTASSDYRKVRVTGTATFRSAPVAMTVWHGAAWVATTNGRFIQVRS